jgi:hypothetical protein
MVAGSLGAGVELRRWGGRASAATEAIAPHPIVAPRLLGAARIGEALVVDEGIWGGDPEPIVSQHWLRDGAPIPGATGESYVPAATDDLASLACRITAANAAGSATAETPPLVATYPAPVASGALADRLFFEGTGAQAVATAGAFAGAGLRFGASGAGASADPETGLVSVPTGVAGAAAAVTVTATNSGGSADRSFAVTVVGTPSAAPGPHLWHAAAEDGVGTFDAGALFSATADPERATLTYSLVAGGLAVEAAVIEGGVLVERADGYLRIDPGQGVVTLDAAAGGPVTGVAIPIRALNGAGAAVATVLLTVTAMPSVLPPVVSEVTVSGSGACWTTHTVTCSVSGDPTPEVAVVWRRNGLPIAGATGPSYMPTASDDGATISADVIATNTHGTHSLSAQGFVAINPELLVNGDFSAGSAGWAAGGSWQFAAGQAHQNGGNNLSQLGVALVGGAQYNVEATMVARTSGQLRLQMVGGGTASTSLPFMSAAGSYSWVAMANPGNDAVRVNGNAVATLDRLSIKRIA